MNEKIIVSESYTKAVALHRKITANAQVAQEALYEMCRGLKEMRDEKLYKELGYQNFEDYCETEIGLKRRQAYKFIAVVENLSMDFVQSTAQIGTTKLALLAKLDEPQREELQQSTDIETTSVRELKNKIKELESAKAEAKERQDKLLTKNKELEQLVEELENRPIEVAVSESDSREIANLKDAMKRVDLDWSQKYNELQEETTKETIANNKKHTAELEQLKSEYEKKLAEAESSVAAEAVPDTKAVFKAYLSNAVDAANRLLGFLENNRDELFVSRTKDFFDIVIKKLEV